MCVRHPIPGLLGVAQSAMDKRSKQGIPGPREGLSMQGHQQHVCGNVLGKSKHQPAWPCLQGRVESEEPEAHWPYLLERPVFTNRWSGLSPNKIPPPERSWDILRSVWVCPRSVPPC